MNAHLDRIKRSILKFVNDVHDDLLSKACNIGEMRVKLIAFRDYIVNKEHAMLLTDFYTLPTEFKAFERDLFSLTTKGGGDECEDGLEALAYAIRSKWSYEWMRRRQVIVVWSDAETHPLRHGESCEFYPKGMAENFQELALWWGDHDHPGCMDEGAKRLVLFTPDTPNWNTISQNWSNVLHFPSEAGVGMTNEEFREILGIITSPDL